MQSRKRTAFFQKPVYRPVIANYHIILNPYVYAPIGEYHGNKAYSTAFNDSAIFTFFSFIRIIRQAIIANRRTIRNAKI